ncbi:unnamed protein product [marine sediment metagenome]|uniref:Uncharacterized protein n=1 Tax=marine sediment metagenome TaxID=412755 RepID=X1FU96_9ZZZZ
MHCTGKLMDNILCNIGTVVALEFVDRNEEAADNWDAARRWIGQLPRDYSCNINLYALLDSIQPDVLRYKL